MAIEVIRMRFKAMILIMFVLLTTIHIAVGVQSTYAKNGSEMVEEGYSSNQIEEYSPQIINVTLKRIYLDGEISEETVKETIWAMEDFWAKYESWQLIDMNEKQLIFEKVVDDISPLLKLNGFFGVSEDGTLSIFNGSPEHEDIIQSFFQIDIQKLEGKKRQQLKQGIPVKSKEIFAEVLETMKRYSIDVGDE